jgi:hypothetical protein
MTLSKKIADDMAILAYKIIQRAGKLDDEKVRKMVDAYNDLDRLLKMAAKVEQQ